MGYTRPQGRQGSEMAGAARVYSSPPAWGWGRLQNPHSPSLLWDRRTFASHLAQSLMHKYRHNGPAWGRRMTRMTETQVVPTWLGGAGRGGSDVHTGEGLQGKWQRGSSQHPASENPDCQRAGVRPESTSPAQLPPYPPLNPGLTPLQTWPPPAPQCGPGSCWQLWGARGADGTWAHGMGSRITPGCTGWPAALCLPLPAQGCRVSGMEPSRGGPQQPCCPGSEEPGSWSGSV